MDNIQKTPLSYQITEYDCGQTTFLNAIRYLFARREISPSMIIKIMQHTLDKRNARGEEGKGGTSIYAMEFLATWINKTSKEYNMEMQAKVLKKKEANIDNEEIDNCIQNGGVAIMSVYETEEHYVLCTKIDSENVYLFDPYLLDSNYFDDDIECEMIDGKPFDFNRKVNKKRLREKSKKDFALVQGENREILLLNRV